jgi:hypothetical protein
MRFPAFMRIALSKAQASPYEPRRLKAPDRKHGLWRPVHLGAPARHTEPLVDHRVIVDARIDTVPPHVAAAVRRECLFDQPLGIGRSGKVRAPAFFDGMSSHPKPDLFRLKSKKGPPSRPRAISPPVDGSTKFMVPDTP